MQYENGLATIGVCVFIASASVGAFFTFKEILCMKKKLISTVLCLVIILSFGRTVFANENVTVKLNGTTLDFDVQPQLIGGRTMVPMRKIFESLGAVVTWDENTSTVTAYNEFYLVKTAIDSNIMTVNGEERTLDVPPMEVNSRTLVPARFVAEAFNCDVRWDASTQTVYITSGKNDYSQVEKETTSINTNSSATTNNHYNTSNYSVFEKLKNAIIKKGEKTDIGYDYSYTEYYNDEPYGFSYSYDTSKDTISLFVLTSEDNNYYSVTISIEPSESDYAFCILNTPKYSVKSQMFGKFDTKNKKFEIIEYKNLDNYRIRETAVKLMGSLISLLDDKMQLDIGVSFADFGLYYDNLRNG